MSKKSVLVISPDVPFPDNYGGALDIWKRILYLQSRGFLVHLVSLYRDESRLLAFEQSAQFSSIAVHIPVKYRPHLSLNMLRYPAAMTIRSIGRNDITLMKQRLLRHYDYVVVENSKNYLAYSIIKKHLRLTADNVYVRMQNCEWEYYDYMAGAETAYLKKIFFKTESYKFKFFEKSLHANEDVNRLLFISDRDMEFFGARGGKVAVLPVYLTASASQVNYTHRKNSLLFIGNLELSDNVKAVKLMYEYIKGWLACNPDCKLIIAGKNSSGINPFASFDLKNVEVMFNVSSEKKDELINSAKVFCSFSMNPAGVKLKTLEGASAGLPILANNNACDGSGLEDAVMNIDLEDRGAIHAKLDGIMKDLAAFDTMAGSVSEAYCKLVHDALAKHAEIFS